MTRISLYYCLTLWLAFCYTSLAAETSRNCFSESQLTGAIVGSILCTLLVAGLIFLTVFLIRRKRKRALKNSSKEENRSKSDISAFAYDNPYFKDEDGESSIPDVEKGVSNEASPAHVSEGSDSAKSNKTLPGANKAKKTKWPKPSNPFGSLLNNKKRAQDDSNLVLEPEVITVSLKGHDFTGLGFNICGNMRDGIFVRDVLHRGPASESGNIKQGDRILGVTVSFANIVYEDALTILSYASPYDVKLKLQKEEALSNLQKKPSLSNLAHNNSERLYHPLYRSQSIDDLSQIGKDPTKSNAKRTFSSGISAPYMQKWEKEKKVGHSEEVIAEVLEVPNDENKEDAIRKISISSLDINKTKFIEVNSGPREKTVEQHPSSELSEISNGKFIVIEGELTNNKNIDGGFRERIPSVAEAKAEIEELHATGVIAAPLTDSSSDSDDQNVLSNKNLANRSLINQNKIMNNESLEFTCEKLKNSKTESSDSETEKIKPKYLKKQDKDGKSTLSRIKRKKDLDASEDLTRLDQQSVDIRNSLNSSSSSDEELNRLDGLRYKRKKRKGRKQRSSSLGDLTKLKTVVDSFEPLRTKSMEFGEIDSKTALFISADKSPHRRYKKKQPSRPNSRNQIQGSRELALDNPYGNKTSPLSDSCSEKSTPEASPGLSKSKPYASSWSTLERSRSWQNLDNIDHQDNELISDVDIAPSKVDEYSSNQMLTNVDIHNEWVDDEDDSKINYLQQSFLPTSESNRMKGNLWTEENENDALDHTDIFIETEYNDDMPPPPPLAPPPDLPKESYLNSSDEEFPEINMQSYPHNLQKFYDKDSFFLLKNNSGLVNNNNNGDNKSSEKPDHLRIVQVQQPLPTVDNINLQPPPILPKPSQETLQSLTSGSVFSVSKGESSENEPELKRKFSFKKGKEVFEISESELNSIMISHQEFLNLQFKQPQDKNKGTKNVLSFVPMSVEKTKEGGLEFETWSFVEKKSVGEQDNAIQIDFDKLKQDRKSIELHDDWDSESSKRKKYNPFLELTDESMTIDLDEETEMEPLIEAAKTDSEDDHDEPINNSSTVIKVQNSNSTNPFLNELIKHSKEENTITPEQKFSNTVYVRLTPSPIPGQMVEKREVTALKLENKSETSGNRYHNGHNYENVVVGTNHVPIIFDNKNEVPILSNIPLTSPGFSSTENPVLVDPLQYQQFLHFQQQMALLNMQFPDNSSHKPIYTSPSFPITLQQQISPSTSSERKTPPPKLESPDDI